MVFFLKCIDGVEAFISHCQACRVKVDALCKVADVPRYVLQLNICGVYTLGDLPDGRIDVPYVGES